MDFRERRIATLRAAQPVLDVAGSEVPNLPDPSVHREAVAALLRRFEGTS